LQLRASGRLLLTASLIANALGLRMRIRMTVSTSEPSTSVHVFMVGSIDLVHCASVCIPNS
jgi:hypothetical protein